MKKGKRLGTTLLAHNFNPALAAYKLLLEKITKPIVNKQNINGIIFCLKEITANLYLCFF